MSRAARLTLGCIGALAFMASAHAADPAGSWRRSPPDFEYEKPEPPYSELMSGWYLRGDLGYRWNHVGPTSVSTIPTVSETYNNALALGVGFGFKYRWFRADVTVDRGGPSRITGNTAAPVLQPQYSAKASTVSTHANIYFDLGTWAGFTPYVGGGAGVTSMTSEQYVDITLAAPSATITGPAKVLNFTWGVMAGVAYQVQPNWMIDVGYRYLHLGDLPGAENAGTLNTAVIFKNLTAQEARFGIRYLFD